MGGTARERAIAGVTSGVLSHGDWVTWQARHFGVPFRMTVTVSEYQRPRRFVDQQRCGPFRAWWHEHTFSERDGVTCMTDSVRFHSPAGLIGSVVDRLLLTPYMTRLLRARNSWLKAELEGRYPAAETHPDSRRV